MLSQELSDRSLRFRKQAPQQPVIQVKDFVGDSGTRLEQHRYQRCLSALIGKISKIVCWCLSPLPGETQEMVLVDIPANLLRQSDRTDRFKALEVLEDVPWISHPRRLSQPCQH